MRTYRLGGKEFLQVRGQEFLQVGAHAKYFTDELSQVCHSCHPRYRSLFRACQLSIPCMYMAFPAPSDWIRHDHFERGEMEVGRQSRFEAKDADSGPPTGLTAHTTSQTPCHWIRLDTTITGKSQILQIYTTYETLPKVSVSTISLLVLLLQKSCTSSPERRFPVHDAPESRRTEKYPSSPRGHFARSCFLLPALIPRNEE